ncbi:MAG: hypothetical protein ACAH27_12760 [Xanthobacteraceae bacterium]|jgi:hypothetical protein
MTKATWMTIPALAATLVLGGAAQGGSIQAPDNVAAASDFSSKGGKGHAKGHAKGHHKAWHGHYAWKSRGANNPHFCPPGQAKKPGLGSAHRC